MKGNPKLVIGLVVLAGFAVVAFLNLKNTMAPYVGFAEARAASGAVQIAGYPDHRRASFDMEQGLFLFTMKDDDGDLMKVTYAGAKPGNFDQAEKVVVVGQYQDGSLHADQILVKCPSKYEEQADERLEEYRREMNQDADATGTE